VGIEPTPTAYHAAPVIVLNQFLWMSKKFENIVSFVNIWVRSSAWDFFPLHFFIYFINLQNNNWFRMVNEHFFISTNLLIQSSQSKAHCMNHHKEESTKKQKCKTILLVYQTKKILLRK
jgi:hypothetical protein